MVKNDEYEYDGKIYQIVIGQNAQENWDIIREAEQNDIWFHVESQPSCHVIIKTDGNSKIHKSIINYAAGLCKINSKAKFAKKAKIIYTLIKNVKIKKGDKIGSVHTSNTKNLSI
jgi:predicted ribosome quality control (RQC) complex YloA/Tae2 family protein